MRDNTARVFPNPQAIAAMIAQKPVVAMWPTTPAHLAAVVALITHLNLLASFHCPHQAYL